MTIRVRQLIRVASIPTPPSPPRPIPTMAFAVQPTDTQLGELFDPVVVVTISNQAADSLTISSLNCDIQPVTVIAGPGGAVFTGLRAGSTSGQGCRLRVHNNSNPQVQDIISDPFDITVVSPVWELIASGSANRDQNVAVTLNTTGSNLIVMTMVGFNIVTPQIFFTDSFGQMPTPLTAFGSLFQLRTSILLPPFQTSTTHTLSLQGTVLSNFPAVNILAFHAPDPVLQIQGPLYGNSVYGTSIESLNAAVIDFRNALVISGFGTSPVTVPPTGYQLEYFLGIPDVNFDTYTGYRILTEPRIERPVWQAEEGNLITNLIVFQGTD